MENKEKFSNYNVTPEQLEKAIREVMEDIKPKEREFTIIAYNESFFREFHEAMREEAKKYKCTIENPLTDGERRRGDFPTDYFKKKYIIGIDPCTDESNES